MISNLCWLLRYESLKWLCESLNSKCIWFSGFSAITHIALHQKQKHNYGDSLNCSQYLKEIKAPVKRGKKIPSVSYYYKIITLLYLKVSKQRETGHWGHSLWLPAWNPLQWFIWRGPDNFLADSQSVLSINWACVSTGEIKRPQLPTETSSPGPAVRHKSKAPALKTNRRTTEPTSL